jgi:hypothetical protein
MHEGVQKTPVVHNDGGLGELRVAALLERDGFRPRVSLVIVGAG